MFQNQSQQQQQHQQATGATMNNAQANLFQTQQQQNMMALGMGAGNPTMMSYMNMNYGGMGAGNLYNMNYGANSGYNYPAVTTAASAMSWYGNQQQYQVQQSGFGFLGGRPPLPPGPPPPDKPEVSASTGDVHRLQSNQLASAPSLVPSSIQHKAPPPPPPPPPPPSNNPASSASALSQNQLKPVDALNILKSAAALGLISSGGSLAQSLNVSEQLFGTTKSNKIPGLDFSEDDKAPSNSPKTEVVDLEPNAETTSKNQSKQQTSFVDKPADKSVEKSEKPPSEEGNSKAVEENGEWPGSTRTGPSNLGGGNNNKNTPPDNDYKARSNENKSGGVVWELRPEITTPNQDWRRQDNFSGNNHNQSGNWRSDQQNQNTNKSQVAAAGNQFGNSAVPMNKNFPQKSDSGKTDTPAVRKVQIPLEASDGKELVYDKKVLKQFDQKFRAWENDFEEWQRLNKNHPDKAKYKEYLDQWNLWREQLKEQRRSILDKMTQARLDCKEVLMAKFGQMEPSADDKISDTDSLGGASCASQQATAVFPNVNGNG